MTRNRQLATLGILAIGFFSALAIMGAFIGLYFSGSQQLQNISKKLYIHPFTVSNAAAELESSLYQMRSDALVIVLMKQQGQDWADSMKSIDRAEQNVFANLSIIQSNFLGDMRKVETLASKIREWQTIRTGILNNVQAGQFNLATTRVRSHGTPLFEEIIGLTRYVRTFAKDRAKQFVTEGENQSATLVRQGSFLSLSLVGVFLFIAGLVFWRIRFLQTELLKLAQTDFLTEVANRRDFLKSLETELVRSERYHTPLSLAVIDLDNFKKINDTYGHAGGDLVLKTFCRVCEASLRDADLVGRIGGEEFGILLPNTTLEAAIEALERVRIAIEATEVTAAGRTIRFTASFGLSHYEAGQTADQFMANADNSLYLAKAQGRNRVCVQALISKAVSVEPSFTHNDPCAKVTPTSSFTT